MRLLSPWILASLLGACDLAEVLEGEACHVDADCARSQGCARTEAERALELPGVCADEDTPCIADEQLGCACMPEDDATGCDFKAVPFEFEYPDMMCDPVVAVCVAIVPDPTTGG